MYLQAADGGARGPYQRLSEGQETYQRLSEGPGSSGRWDAAPDLERFLASFYQYFEARGHRGAVAQHLSSLAALAFTVAFSFMLLFFVDWQAILSCKSEETCRTVTLFYKQPFHEVGFGRFGVLLCFLLFFVYWTFNIVAAYHDIRDATEMSIYYKDRLGIVSDEALATMLWSEVVSRLIQQQKSSPFCIVQEELTALEIANVIMREDNFMVALTNQHAFTSRLPPWIPPRLAYTRAALWNVRTAIFRWAFDHRGRVRADFLDNPSALATRFRWLGLLNLLLMVPVLAFGAIYFVMRHAEEFRSHRSSPFRQQWTDYAKWTFREFNELPHQFHARLYSAQAMAEEYVGAAKRSHPVLESLQRFVKFIAGSILAVLLLVAVWDDTPLLFVKIQDKNLLWYLACFGFLFALADNAGAEDGGQGSSRGRPLQARSLPLRMYIALMRLVTCTHYLPQSWRAPAPLGVLAGACGGVRRAQLCQHFEGIRAELLRNFFLHRIQALAEELLGVVLTPLLLIVYLPEMAPDIVDVIRRARHSSPHLGDWCAFGCLDPSRHGSELHGSSLGPEATDGPAAREDAVASSGSKLEKSAVSFVLAHRLLWCPDEDPRASAPGARDISVVGGTRHGRRSPPPPGGRAADVAIPMRVLTPAAPGAGPAPCALEQGTTSLDLWGFPASALQLVRSLEDFSRRELSAASPNHELYNLLPEELLHLVPVSPEPDEPLQDPAQARRGPPEGDIDEGSCGSHFYWLEQLIDCRSSPHALRQHEAARPPDDGEGAVFELLESDPTDAQA